MTEPLSGRAVQREVLADALQHPATLYPLAAGCLAGIYALFFSPVFGGTLPALAFGLGSAILGAVSFAWRYLVQGERSAREKVRKKVAEEAARRRLESHVELARLRRELEEGLTTVGSRDGLQALCQLNDEWRRVQKGLAESDDDDPILSIEITRSVRETYRQGLGSLAQALALMEAVEATDRLGLQADAAELEAELARTSRSGAEAERIPMKQGILESHQQRLLLLAQQELQIEKLLQEAALAEGALQHARVALPTLSMDLSERGAGEVGETLQRTVDRAQRVRQRLRGEAIPVEEDERDLQEKNEKVR